MGVLINLLAFIGTWIAYNFLINIYEERIQGKPPLVANTWLDFITRRSVNAQALIKRGYETYSKRGLPFRYYEGFGHPHYVMPPSHFASVRRAPDHIINSSPAHEDNLVLYPFLGDDSYDTIVPTRTFITKSINSLIPTIEAQIKKSLALHFPSKPTQKYPHVKDDKGGRDWTPTNIHVAVLPTAAGLFSRILLGNKYAENPDFTRLIADFAQGVSFQQFLLRLLPRWVCFKIAPLFNTTRRVRKIEAYVRGDIISLVRKWKKEHEGKDSVAHDDFADGVEGEELLILPMLVDYVLKQDDYATYTEDALVKSILGRLLGIAFATIDTTTLTTTHVMHDLVSQPFSLCASKIITQSQQALQAAGGKWTVKSLGELTYLDSFIKEVQRLRPVGYLLGKRQVMPSSGAIFVSGAAPLDIPGYTGSHTGPEIHVPHGGMVHMPLWGLHSDNDLYADAETFKGFRFAGDRVPSSQPTDRFVSFGYGRHACPGRYLALTIIKLFVLEFLAQYEFREGEERLKSWSFETACVPDLEGRVVIRRREGVEVC